MLDTSKIRNAVPRQALFTSIDLSDAFYHIPVHPRFQKYLSFTAKGRLFMFQAMPFSIKLGPLIFTKVITEVLKQLHKDHIAASVYIDDWLLWNTSESQLATNTSITSSLLISLGFTINWEKSQLQPLPSITYLGVTWNGPNYTIVPSQRNIDKAAMEATNLLANPLLTKKNYQRFLGSINFITQGRFQLRLVIQAAPRFRHFEHI